MSDRARWEHRLSRRDWSSADLARMAGVSMSTVQAILAGRDVDPAALKRVERALDRRPHIDDDALLR